MSIQLRLCAAAASVIVVSSAVGFELGAANRPVANQTISHGPGVDSPGSSRRNSATRSVAGLSGALRKTRSLSTIAFPAANSQGPSASDIYIVMAPKRPDLSACLMASN